MTPPAPASPPATTCARASRRRCSPGPRGCCPTDARPLLAACDAGIDDAGVDALQQAMLDAGVLERAEQPSPAQVDAGPPRARPTSTSTPRPRPPCAPSPTPSRGGTHEGRRHRRRALRPVRRLPPRRPRATTSPCSSARRSSAAAPASCARGASASTPGPIVMTMPELLRRAASVPSAVTPRPRCRCGASTRPTAPSTPTAASCTSGPRREAMREEIRPNVRRDDAAGFRRFLRLARAALRGRDAAPSSTTTTTPRSTSCAHRPAAAGCCGSAVSGRSVPPCDRFFTTSGCTGSSASRRCTRGSRPPRRARARGHHVHGHRAGRVLPRRRDARGAARHGAGRRRAPGCPCTCGVEVERDPPPRATARSRGWPPPTVSGSRRCRGVHGRPARSPTTACCPASPRPVRCAPATSPRRPSCGTWGRPGHPAAHLRHHNIHFGADWDGAFEAIIDRGELMPDPSRLVTVPTSPTPPLAPPGSTTLYVLEPVPNLRRPWTGRAGPGRCASDCTPSSRPAATRPTSREELLVDPARLAGAGHAPGHAVRPGSHVPAVRAVPAVEHRPAGARPGVRGVRHAARRRHADGARQRQARGGARAGVRGPPDRYRVRWSGDRRTPAASPEALAAGYARCAEITREHGTTYYWGARLLPAERRRHVHAVYALCRLADDIVDDLGRTRPAARRRPPRSTPSAILLRRLAAGARPDPVMAAVGHRVRACGIDEECFERFFGAMAQDLTRRTYETWDDLLGYMDGSAAVIGEMMLPVLRPRSRDAVAPARALGLAFQLTNFLRDVGEDLDRGRVYVPAGGPAPLRGRPARPRSSRPSGASSCASRSSATGALYREADGGIPLLPAVVGACVSTARTLYARILERIEAGTTTCSPLAQGCRPCARRPSPPAWSPRASQCGSCEPTGPPSTRTAAPGCPTTPSCCSTSGGCRSARRPSRPSTTTTRPSTSRSPATCSTPTAGSSSRRGRGASPASRVSSRTRCAATRGRVRTSPRPCAAALAASWGSRSVGSASCCRTSATAPP